MCEWRSERCGGGGGGGSATNKQAGSLMGGIIMTRLLEDR